MSFAPPGVPLEAPGAPPRCAGHGAGGEAEDERLHAVLIEPQLERFRSLHELHGVPLTVTFEGWHRHAILTPERVFLFPRDRSRVPGLRRDASTLRALEGRGVSAPHLLGQWTDRESPLTPTWPSPASPGAPGRTWSGGPPWRRRRACWRAWGGRSRPGTASTGAPWRAASPGAGRRGAVPGHRPGGAPPSAPPASCELPRGRADSWLRTLEPLPRMAPVLVHGDVNEGQILVDEGLRVTGVLDWETAHVGHPLKDFDLGEWGYGIFSWDAHFHLLRRRMWEAYAKPGGATSPPGRRCTSPSASAGRSGSPPARRATPGPGPAWRPPSTTCGASPSPGPRRAHPQRGAGGPRGRPGRRSCGVVMGRPQPGQLQVDCRRLLPLCPPPHLQPAPPAPARR